MTIRIAPPPVSIGGGAGGAAMIGEVLVAFGTRHESTRGIAAAVAEVLRAAGIPVQFASIDAVGDLGHVRAAVLGSVVYDGGWLPGAHDFLATHERELAAIPTWLFASGPLEHVPPGAKADLPDDLVDVIGRVGPRDVALFAGSLQPHHLASGLRLLSKLARTNVGDHRDWVAIERWANGIRDALLAEQPAVVGTAWRSTGGS
jgi:menaquinone-dependent protoporphyrinogen oxidase